MVEISDVEFGEECLVLEYEQYQPVARDYRPSHNSSIHDTSKTGEHRLNFQSEEFTKVTQKNIAK